LCYHAIVTRDQVRRVIGYLRVSTEEQVQSGAGLEAQKGQLQQEAERRGWELVDLAIEDAATGKTMRRRVALEGALRRLRAKEADALVVSKLDRLARSLKDFVELTSRAQREGWVLICLDIDLDTSTPSGQLAVNVRAAVADFEGALISQRVREAMAAKKRLGTWRNGRGPGRPRMVTQRLSQRIAGLRHSDGMSYERIAALLTEEGHPTPSGGQRWIWTTVKRIAERTPAP
jgi:DNA invertase Pin-like site-specific DNA recombinase